MNGGLCIKMRRGYRRYRPRRRYYNDDKDDDYGSSNSILFVEFKFYNGKNRVVTEDELKEIEDGLKKQNSLFWTNKDFISNGVFFWFYKHPINKEKTEFDCFVRLFEYRNCGLTAKQVCNTKYKGEELMFGFVPTESQISLIANIDADIQLRYFATWEDYVNYLIIHNLFGKYCEEYDFTKFKNDMRKLFSFDDFKTPKYELLDEGVWINVMMFHIMKVIEVRIREKNYRVAMLGSPSNYGGSSYYVRTISESDKEYNYVDENRIVVQINKRLLFFDTGINEYNDEKLRFFKRVFIMIRDNVGSILSDNECFITATMYRFYRERVADETGDSKYMTEREKQIVAQYKKLLNLGRKVKLNGMLMTQRKIMFEDDMFNIEFGENFLNVCDKFGEIKKLINSDLKYNINEFYEKLLSLSFIKKISMDYTTSPVYKNFSCLDFTINGLHIVVEKDNNRIKINGIFSRIDDVHYVLSKAICYGDVDSYNSYLKDISNIGVDWKKMINNGIKIRMTNPFYSIFEKTKTNIVRELNLRFSLVWDAEKRKNVYLLINGEKYLIRYKGKFKKNFNFPSLNLTMKQFKKYLSESITDITDDAIIEIVENSMKEALIVQKRGEELVRNTIKDVGAIECEIEIQGGHKIIGYAIKGRRTEADYFVDKTQLTVYKKVNGNWNRRCVVDDHNKQRIFEDRLANRLVNIYNEPEYIYTLHNI